ncbi:hypothetical protein DCS_04247 [Drechmeria coniospora]|uniref:Uncharacterized protein n=1 Tax=Drechmeria coniospora TaxID=98403 RepID=A0A151GJG0_DRECN|nr:hypothetical protein DCS_04247 [Drechmeria coniospora]KYK57240.1 hypothetical protein DCS_04247 [Drechmeria coniospora]
MPLRLCTSDDPIGIFEKSNRQYAKLVKLVQDNIRKHGIEAAQKSSNWAQNREKLISYIVDGIHDLSIFNFGLAQKNALQYAQLAENIQRDILAKVKAARGTSQMSGQQRKQIIRDIRDYMEHLEIVSDPMPDVAFDKHDALTDRFWDQDLPALESYVKDKSDEGARNFAKLANKMANDLLDVGITAEQVVHNENQDLLKLANDVADKATGQGSHAPGATDAIDRTDGNWARKFANFILDTLQAFKKHPNLPLGLPIAHLKLSPPFGLPISHLKPTMAGIQGDAGAKEQASHHQVADSSMAAAIKPDLVHDIAHSILKASPYLALKNADRRANFAGFFFFEAVVRFLPESSLPRKLFRSNAPFWPEKGSTVAFLKQRDIRNVIFVNEAMPVTQTLSESVTSYDLERLNIDYENSLSAWFEKSLPKEGITVQHISVADDHVPLRDAIRIAASNFYHGGSTLVMGIEQQDIDFVTESIETVTKHLGGKAERIKTSVFGTHGEYTQAMTEFLQFLQTTESKATWKEIGADGLCKRTAVGCKTHPSTKEVTKDSKDVPTKYQEPDVSKEEAAKGQTQGEAKGSKYKAMKYKPGSVSSQVVVEHFGNCVLGIAATTIYHDAHENLPASRNEKLQRRNFFVDVWHGMSKGNLLEVPALVGSATLKIIHKENGAALAKSAGDLVQAVWDIPQSIVGAANDVANANYLDAFAKSCFDLVTSIKELPGLADKITSAEWDNFDAFTNSLIDLGVAISEIPGAFDKALDDLKQAPTDIGHAFQTLPATLSKAAGEFLHQYNENIPPGTDGRKIVDSLFASIPVDRLGLRLPGQRIGDTVENACPLLLNAYLQYVDTGKV